MNIDFFFFFYFFNFFINFYYFIFKDIDDNTLNKYIRYLC